MASWNNGDDINAGPTNRDDDVDVAPELPEETFGDDVAEGVEEAPPKGEPDVLLDVPNLSVEDIALEVEDLHARVSLRAEVLDLLRLNVGADVDLGRVSLKITGVQAEAMLKVRLDRVAQIIERVLTTIDRNPQILERLVSGLEPAVRGVGSAVGDIGAGGRKAIEDVGGGAGGAVEDVGRGAGGAVEDLGGTAAETGRRAVGAVTRTAEEAPADITDDEYSEDYEGDDNDDVGPRRSERSRSRQDPRAEGRPRRAPTLRRGREPPTHRGRR